MEDNIGQSDENLAKTVQKGKIEAFGVLITRYEAKLSRYARKFISGQQDIEDMIQNIFLKAYKNIQSFNPDLKFSTWIYAISHNELVNFLKKQKRWPVISIDTDTFFPAISDKKNVFEDILKEEELEIIDKCLHDMSDKYREIIVLYYFESLDYRQIADVLRIPINTVGVRLKRAKGQIKKNLSKKWIP